MSTITKNYNNGVTNVNVTSKPDVPVIKAYKDPVEPREKAGVSFSRESAAAETSTNSNVSESKPTSEPGSEQDSNVELSAEEKRKARRDEWSQANQIKNRAIQAEKEAKEALAQARAFQELVAKTDVDPLELAKALGKDPNEFLRKYQNAMFNIKEEEKPKPEEDVKTRLDRYEQAELQRQQKHQELQSNMIRQNYISSNILPAIKADTEKFQILNTSNLERTTAHIYDIMNSHYQATGETLNVNDVAEEYENMLAKEFEDKLQFVKKIGKFSKYFREEKVEQTEQEVEAPPQLGAKKTISSERVPSVPPVLGQGQKQHVPFNDKSARLQRVMKKFG